MINIKSDSRKIKPGDIFVALKGISSNGSDYIKIYIREYYDLPKNFEINYE